VSRWKRQTLGRSRRRRLGSLPEGIAQRERCADEIVLQFRRSDQNIRWNDGDDPRGSVDRNGSGLVALIHRHAISRVMALHRTGCLPDAARIEDGTGVANPFASRAIRQGGRRDPKDDRQRRKATDACRHESILPRMNRPWEHEHRRTPRDRRSERITHPQCQHAWRDDVGSAERRQDVVDAFLVRGV
jgi:hypothetical protein